MLINLFFKLVLFLVLVVIVWVLPPIVREILSFIILIYLVKGLIIIIKYIREKIKEGEGRAVLGFAIVILKAIIYIALYIVMVCGIANLVRHFYK